MGGAISLTQSPKHLLDQQSQKVKTDEISFVACTKERPAPSSDQLANGTHRFKFDSVSVDKSETKRAQCATIDRTAKHMHMNRGDNTRQYTFLCVYTHKGDVSS